MPRFRTEKEPGVVIPINRAPKDDPVARAEAYEKEALQAIARLKEAASEITEEMESEMKTMGRGLNIANHALEATAPEQS